MLDDLLYLGFTKSENDLHEKSDDLLHCILVGLLIFCASLGCVSGILSQFEMEVNYSLIIILLFIAAMFLALIHISKFFYITGYFLFLFLFSYALFSLRTYANSGYQAILNIVNQAYSDHYLLSSFREYTEMVDDRYVTITCVIIFLGLFLVLLLNVEVFNNMFYSTAVFLTFFPLQFGIFIGKYPSYLSLFLLFFSYFGIFLLRHSCHFHFVQPPRRNRKREYSLDYYDRKNRLIIFHKSNARAMISLSLLALVSSLVFSVFTTSVIKQSEAQSILNRSSFKAALDENVKILTQAGIMGLFNRYEAKGGISGGKLGGVRSVSPDYETDLLVTFVPYSFETLYLKGYTSWLYTGSSWDAPSSGNGYAVNMPSSLGPSSESETAAGRILSESHALSLMKSAGIIDPAEAHMKIENVDADTGYLYMPYCISTIPEAATAQAPSVLTGYSGKDDERIYDLAPLTLPVREALLNGSLQLTGLYDDKELSDLKDYEEEVYKNYLQIPPTILEDLMSFHDKIGTAKTTQGQIDLIYDYFLDNYTYDMAPGATPYNKDFVTYFLTEQKRGYCAHFASAGALLLRSYGIPARYVEGYVITATGITESGELNDTDASFYYTGRNPLGDQPVITTSVTDGDAHAWIEVYVSGFGWVPVDLTVPSSGQPGASYADFLSSLSNLLRPGYIPEGSSDEGASDTLQKFDPVSFLNLKGLSGFNIFSALIIALMLIPFFRYSFKHLRLLYTLRKRYGSGDHAPMVSHVYMKASKHLAKACKSKPSLLISDNTAHILRLIACNSKKGKKISRYLNETGLSIDDINRLTGACFYAKEKISRADADLLIRFYRSI